MNNTPRSIGELSERTGRPRSTLIYWINQGWLPAKRYEMPAGAGYFYRATLADAKKAEKLAREAARVSRPRRNPRQSRLK